MTRSSQRASSRNLHATLGRLIDELRGVLAQTARQLLDVLGRGPALLEEALEIGEPVAGERADVLAIVLDHFVETPRGICQMVGRDARALNCADYLRTGGLNHATSSCCRVG